MKSKFNSRLILGLSAITFALAAPSAYSATETFNTEGTTNWLCPAGVTKIQVECWGGGGAGGAGTKATNTGTNTSQNGGGGGGGGYAMMFSVPVTPGLTYTITIPPAAVSGTNGTTTNGQGRVNGSNVTFVGDSGVTVTAAGGIGGANAYTTVNSTIAAAAGAGASAAASLGDLTFAGGSGSPGNTGGTNVSGSGGGGAGDGNPGGNATTTTSTTIPGTGGVAGGGDGGAGRTGGNTNEGVGAPGSTPGGGGGGAKNQGVSSWLGGTGGLGQIVLSYGGGPEVVKANNADDLNLTTSWVGGALPGSTERAKWDATVTGANTTLLGSDLTFGGIGIANPAGPVTINPGNTLTLGAELVDIDLSTATQDLTLNCNLAMGAPNLWDIAAGRTLTLGGIVSGSGVNIQGSGTTILQGANTFIGGARVSNGTLKLGASEVIPHGTGTGNLTINGTLDLNGFNEEINGFNGSGVVDNTTASTDSTLTVGSNNAAGSFSGTLQNSGSAATLALTKTGTGALTLSGASSHSGLTTINGGAVTIQNASALGSTAAGTVVNGIATGSAANARLDLSGGITVTGEAITISGVGNFLGALGSASGDNEWAGNVTIAPSGAGITRLGAAALATLKVSGVVDSGMVDTGLVIRTSNITDSTVILSGANTYLGRTWVAVGKLQLDGGDNRLPVATRMSMGATTNITEFDLNGRNQELAGLAIEPGATAANNAVNNSSATLSTLTVNTAAPSSFAGIVQGNLALTKSGADTLTLAGANTYTGATNVTAGTLLFSSAGSGVSDINVSGGASAGALVAATDGKFFNVGDLTLGNNSVLAIDYSSTNPSTTVAPLDVADFTVGTGLGLRINGSNLAGLVVSQSYPLVTWATSGPADGSAFTTVLNPRLQGTFSVSGKTLLFNVTANTGGSPISWKTGDGTWDTATSNWVDVNLATTTYFDTFDAVLFGDAAGATGNPVVTLNNAFSPTAVVMNSSARDYTLTGTGSVGGNASLTLDPANTRTLTILNANANTGATAVNGGTLQLGNGGTDGALSATSPISIGTGATFVVNQSDTVTQGTDFGAGAISGEGSFTQAGAGTTILNAANTYSGSTAINSGTLQATVNTTVNGVGTSAVSIGAGTTLLLNNTATTGTTAVGNVFSGTGLLNVQFAANTTARNMTMANVTGFAGTIQLSSLGVTGDKWAATGLASVAGPVIVDAGNSIFVASGTTDFTGGITLNGIGNSEGRGAIRLSNGTLSGNIILASDSTINLDNAAAVLSGNITSGAAGAQTLTLGATASTGGTLSGVIGGGTGTLNIATAVGGTYTLTNANTFTGTTNINAGILQLGNVDALGGNNPGVTGTSGVIMTAGTLRSTFDGVIVHSPITTSGTVRIGAPTNIDLGQSGTTLAINGVIGGIGDVTYGGSASSNSVNIVLLNAQNNYSGNTLIDTYNVTASQLSVKLGTHNALPISTVLTIDGQTGAGTGRDAELNLNGFNQTLAGLTNTVRSLRVQRVVNSDVSPYATLTINNTSDFSFGANAGTNSAATIGGTARGSVGGTATPGSTTGSNLGLTKNGSGKFTLENSNPYYGTTTILGGILSLGSSTAMQNSPLDTLNSVAGDASNGLQTTVTELTLGGLTGNKNLASVFTTTSGGYDGVTALTLNPVTGATHSYTGVIADGAAGMTLTKSAAGTQVLAGANSYTGATGITAGTLALGANDVIPNGSPVSLGAATLDAATFTDLLGTLDVTAAATINLGAGGALAFADSSDPGLDWTGGTLAITGTFVSGASLRFGTTENGLTNEQLALISASGFSGFDLDTNGFLIATQNGYSAWAAANAPTTGNNPGADEDGDGVSNGVEFALGGTISTNDLNKLPAVSTSGTDMVFTFNRDQDSIDGSTVLEIEVGTTLALWPDVFAVPAGAAANNPGITVVKDSSPGFDTITLTVPRGSDPLKFARLKVTVTP